MPIAIETSLTDFFSSLFWWTFNRANPVQAGSQAEFSQWLCHVHNVVNRRYTCTFLMLTSFSSISPMTLYDCNHSHYCQELLHDCKQLIHPMLSLLASPPPMAPTHTILLLISVYHFWFESTPICRSKCNLDKWPL